MLYDLDLHEIFECAHLKFTASGQFKQASIDTHMHAQCSHVSVGLAQARPKNFLKCMGIFNILYVNLCLECLECLDLTLELRYFQPNP